MRREIAFGIGYFCMAMCDGDRLAYVNAMCAAIAFR